MFLALFGKSSSINPWSVDWQKEQTLDRKRRSVLMLLRAMLSYGDNKHTIGATELVGKTKGEVQKILNIIAEENTKLSAYDTPEKICAIRRGCVEAHLAKLEKKRDEMLHAFKQVIGWRSSASPIQYKDGKPGLYNNNCRECVDHLTNVTHWGNHHYTRLNAERDCNDIVRKEEAIYEIKGSPLQAEMVRDNPFKPATLEAIANYCKFLSTLNTPEKVLDAHIREFELLNLAPLKNQIAQVQERLETDLATLDAQLEREKVVCKAFIDSLWGCTADLSDNPIVEKKPLTTTDVAMILEHLPKRHALARTSKAKQDDEHEPTVFLITTLDTPDVVSVEQFQSRLEDIRTRTRDKYCLPREVVEAQLREREKDVIGVENTLEDDIEDAGELDLVRFED